MDDGPGRLALFIASLAAGGAERVLSGLANAWAERGRDVLLVTLAPASSDFYTLHRAVRRVGLGLLKDSSNPLEAVRANARRLAALRLALSEARPEVLVSFMTGANVLSLAASKGLSFPVVVSERIDPREWSEGWFWSAARQLLYPSASALVVATESVAAWAKEEFRRVRVHVIPNPVLVSGGRGAPSPLPADRVRTVLAMGRMTRQKGFDLLLAAFGRVVPRHPGWRLVILGGGEERPRLDALVRELGIADKVSMPGTTRDPSTFFSAAEIFVLSSRFEGFPNALLEAMAHGLPVIAADCPSGPAEIVTDGEDGLLVPREDVPALASGLDRLMSDPEERARLGARAKEVRERFSLDRILALWDDLLAEVVRAPRGR
ncbi:MAG: glycosyltransferase family 4 protein [Planctomycetes bacterium]|nr:glycosyltransferase family 4 protein [Planctomycetota bacterium]